jgi:hypothetical protein
VHGHGHGNPASWAVPSARAVSPPHGCDSICRLPGCGAVAPAVLPGCNHHCWRAVLPTNRAAHACCVEWTAEAACPYRGRGGDAAWPPLMDQGSDLRMSRVGTKRWRWNGKASRDWGSLRGETELLRMGVGPDEYWRLRCGGGVPCAGANGRTLASGAGWAVSAGGFPNSLISRVLREWVDPSTCPEKDAPLCPARARLLVLRQQKSIATAIHPLGGADDRAAAECERRRMPSEGAQMSPDASEAGTRRPVQVHVWAGIRPIPWPTHGTQPTCVGHDRRGRAVLARGLNGGYTDSFHQVPFTIPIHSFIHSSDPILASPRSFPHGTRNQASARLPGPRGKAP